MPDDGGWKRRATRRVFESPWFNVRCDEITLPGGEEILYHVVEHGGFALVVPLLDDGRVVMERIYRWPVQEWVLECPSGGLDGEAPEVAARRELEEETGYLAGELHGLGRFAASDGYADERFEVFLATGVEPGGTLCREVTEQIELVLVPLPELRAKVFRGEVADAPSALAILLASEHPASQMKHPPAHSEDPAAQTDPPAHSEDPAAQTDPPAQSEVHAAQTKSRPSR